MKTKPRIGSKYYRLSYGYIERLIWSEDGYDKFMFATGNYFKTKKEATAYLKKINNKITKIFV
jgi:hypothetical protein